MNTDQYHFLVNKTHRDDAIRQAHRQRLISQATRRATPRAVATVLVMVWQSLFR